MPLLRTISSTCGGDVDHLVALVGLEGQVFGVGFHGLRHVVPLPLFSRKVLGKIDFKSGLRGARLLPNCCKPQRKSPGYAEALFSLYSV